MGDRRTSAARNAIARRAATLPRGERHVDHHRDVLGATVIAGDLNAERCPVCGTRENLLPFAVMPHTVYVGVICAHCAHETIGPDRVAAQHGQRGAQRYRDRVIRAHIGYHGAHDDPSEIAVEDIDDPDA